MADRSGEQLGNYQLLRLLDHGAYGEVYLGKQLYLENYAAIKVLHSHLYLHDQAKQDFQAEAKRLSHLTHPNIVRVLDYGIASDCPYLVMEYAPNGSLRKRHPLGSRLSLDTVVSYVEQISSALQYIHQQKMIHRDVKPGNILISANNTLLLSDVGLTIIAHTEASLSMQEALGTPSYMAPEQARGKAVPASDQYALGIMVYEWLCGELPFTSTSRGGLGALRELEKLHRSVQPTPLQQKLATIPLAVEVVTLKALNKNPQERFADVQAFANQLKQSIQPLPLQSLTSPTVANFKMPLSQLSLPTVMPNPLLDYTLPTLIKTQLEESHQSKNIVPPVDQTSFSNVTILPQLPSPHKVLLDQLSQPLLPSTPQPQHVLPIADALPTKGNVGSKMSKPRWRGKHWWSTIIVVLLILLLIFGGIAYAEPGMFFSLTSTLFRSPSAAAATARVTITPISKDLKTPYTIYGVTTPDASKQQVGTRMLSVTMPPRTQTVTAKQFTFPATHASGHLYMYNQLGGNAVTVHAGDVYSNNDGCTSLQLDMVVDETITVQAQEGNITGIPGHILQVGSIGNLSTINCVPALRYSYSSNGVCNPTCWAIGTDNDITGGQDAYTGPVVQKSDIDGAANSLTSTNKPDPQQELQPQIKSNEQLVGTPLCTPKESADHQAGDRVAQVKVSVTFTCTGEVYDQQGALAMAKQWFMQDATHIPGPNYILVGTIVMTPGQAYISNSNQGIVLIPITEEGIWVYQFSSAQEQAMAKQILGKKKTETYAVLLRQQGVAQVNIQLSGGDGNTLPKNSQQIRFVILSVNGK